MERCRGLFESTFPRACIAAQLVKPPLGAPIASPIKVPGLGHGYFTLSVHLLSDESGRQPMMVQVLGFMPVTWVTPMEFLISGFSLAQLQMLWLPGE